ncbi:DUF3329 domain-containing protein [Devosia rhodophyticola]|uniref:DUF3329 domain-containing protein n=1 Tax=Devosia rhodophyticola TaxID=3026423 RepID=A0ABY7YXI9_9HYPH|nr:DUF3329 domain-containing protein [Devosia rhodophyticola]WDR06074.1 DUF3329 domain-containing protein [Devosia rhodophyticola]
MKESDLNWFRPLWRRVAITVFLAIWCGWEWFGTKDQFWGLLTGFALAYALYTFFYAYPRAKSDDDAPPPPEA